LNLEKRWYRIIMDEYLTTKEIAKLFKVQEITIRRWINKSWLPAFKIGKMYRVKKQDLGEFVEKRKKKVL